MPIFNDIQWFTLSIILGSLIGILVGLLTNEISKYEQLKNPKGNVKKSRNYIILFSILLILIFSTYLFVFFIGGSIPDNYQRTNLSQNVTIIEYHITNITKINITIENNNPYCDIVSIFNRRYNNSHRSVSHSRVIIEK